MNEKEEKSDKKIKYIQIFCMIIVVATTLNLFVGIVPAESKTVTNAEAVQNGKNDSQENFIGTTSFETRLSHC
ncbi:MAG: hypothetical protein U9N61_05490 [Euryarchaeota archaeon]|nr:hypothetical protein [Euryarchaeota archaeon]